MTVDACPQSDSLIYEGSFRAVLLTLGETDDDGIILGHNGDVDVGGHVWSNSKLDLEQPDPHGHERRSSLGMGQLQPARQHRDAAWRRPGLQREHEP